jgi:hypothetical protein
VQSQPLRAWKLGFATSHGSQVPSPKYDMDDAYMAATFLGGEAWDKSLEVNPCNLSRQEHGS